MLLTRVPAQQATLIARANDRTYVVTANPGLLMALSPARAARGTYESDVKDARFVVDLGRDRLARERAGRLEGRGLQPIGQHQDAGRSVERLGGAVRQRRRLADHQPEGAIPAVARRADRDVGESRC